MIPVFLTGWLGGNQTITITSPMGIRRGRKHNGVDMRAAVGTSIKAPHDGKVMAVKTQKNGAGLYLVLRIDVSSSEYYTIYFMHLKEVKVSIGQDVKAGTEIALSGGAPSDIPNCGISSGPHLHFEIRKQGIIPVNPLQFLSEKCILKNNGLTLWNGRTTVLNPQDLHSVSEYANLDITSVSDLNEAEQDKKKIKKKIVTGAQERLAPGIWQIVKLLIDSSAANRQIFDSSISIQTGSLINFFNKMCQQPLVEFSGDTYGDQYYFMVRKPPYDKEGVKKMQELTLTIIEDKDIRSTNIGWNKDNIYSWYQMIPYSEFASMSQVNLYMPAIFFPEYAAIWGSRDLTVQNQYVNYFQSGDVNTEVDNDKKANGENIIKNATRDLKYIIESNAYNPFTRQGTIILNGDRRIKRGALIMMPNGEQFYVDAVSNNFSVNESSISRTTTLTVSRGMMAKYVDGVKIDGKIMSYFNIIDFGKDFKISDVTAENWKDLISTWKVDIDVFSFFLRRSQMLK